MRFAPHSAGAAFAAGVLLLLFGRRLYWLFVGTIGFAAGFLCAQRFAQQQPVLVILAIALVTGLIGAVLAVWLQEAMVLVAGFLVGAALGSSLFTPADAQTISWLGAVIGGVVGALLVLLVFDWALIVLSSFGGAALVAQSLGLDRSLAAIVFVLAALVGVAVQAQTMGGRDGPHAPRIAP